jgi:hypothetical protein
VIRKDNTIAYLGNRYALPLGSYAPDKRVAIREDDGLLIITNPDDELELISYPLCLEKGRLIKNSDCRREKNKGITAYLQEVVQILNNSSEANEFFGLVRQDKPRYIRDQLKIIKDNSKDKPAELIQKSLNYCLKNRLYSATDFVDALNYFQSMHSPGDIKHRTNDSIKPLCELDRSVLKTKVEVRDMNIYIKELQGVRDCQQKLINLETI